MLEFLRDAPTGSLVLFFLSLPVLLVASPIRLLRLQKNLREVEQSPIREPSGIGGFLLVEVLGWGLLGLSLLWYILG